MRAARAAAGILAGGATLALVAAAAAQGLNTTAIRIDLGPARAVAGFEVGTDGTRDMLVHARLFAWTQDGGQDRLLPTERVAVNPAIFELRPGERQLVRVGLVGAPGPAAAEQAFRLLVDEVPDQTLPEPGQVRTAVRLSLPVFVAGSGPRAMRIEAGLPHAKGVPLRNLGNAHVRVDAVSLRDRAGGEVAARRIFLYLLPGAEMLLPLPLAPGLPARVARVALETNAGPLSSEPR